MRLMRFHYFRFRLRENIRRAISDHRTQTHVQRDTPSHHHPSHIIGTKDLLRAFASLPHVWMLGLSSLDLNKLLERRFESREHSDVKGHIHSIKDHPSPTDLAKRHRALTVSLDNLHSHCWTI